MSNMTKARFWMLVVFLVPPISLLIVFIYYLCMQSFWFAFFRFNAGQMDGFYGLGNFRDVLVSDRFAPAVWVTLKIVFWVSLLQIAGGFLLAYALVRSRRWVQSFGRVALFIPVVLPGTVVAILWKFFYTPEGGLLNEALSAIGLSGLTHAWLGTTETALYASIFVNIWKYIGLTMIFFYLAMLNVSKDQLEAARVDGATSAKELWHIYLPSVKPIVELNLVMTVLGSLKAFDIYNMLTNGGPVGSTTTVTKLIVDSISYQNYGQGAAISVMLFAAIGVVTVVIRRTMGGTEQ